MNPPVASKILTSMERASWIRKMFEEGAHLKRKYGSENVFDFSLGNPDLLPPMAFNEVLTEEARRVAPGLHGYMQNPGYEETRRAVALQVERDHGARPEPSHIIMTCGAAGGLNCIFKAILDPGDEVIVPSPFFVEYGFYVDNHGGRLVPVPTREDFGLDLESIDGALNEKTRAVLINSPNNPTGVVYTKKDLEDLGRLLKGWSNKIGRTIYLVSDEPYRRLIFDDVVVPGLFPLYDASIVATSFSKDLSIAGERIGYVAINPAFGHAETLSGAITLANRILGFVNAPALMQRVVARVIGETVDVDTYRRRRDLFADILTEAGLSFVMPQGGFYLFPKSPIPDDKAFSGMLQEERILVVPGSGFGCPGHIRIAFCVGEDQIERSREGFKRAFNRAVSS